MNYKIVFLGSGNLATNLSLALKAAGEDIIQIFSRTKENAQALADKLHCDSCTSINDIRTDADVYIFSVKDDALPSLIEQLAVKFSSSLPTGEGGGKSDVDNIGVCAKLGERSYHANRLPRFWQPCH